MPSFKIRGGLRGCGRSMAKRRRPRPRQPSSLVTADDSNVNGIESFEKVINHQSQSKSLTRKKQRKYNNERELSLPQIKPTIIPHNSTLLTLLSPDNDSDCIMMDDELDHIQWELELILTPVIVRRNTVQDELTTFKSMQFVSSSHEKSHNLKLPTIRPRAADEILPVNECCRPKFEFDPTCKELPPNKSDRFWSMVQPYLDHVSKNDLKWLYDKVKSYDSIEKLYEIPPLGEHYVKNWAKKELEIQKKQSSCSSQSLERCKHPERISPDVVELVNKYNSSLRDGNGYTPLFREVVMNLSEHSFMENPEELFSEYDDKPREMSNVCKKFYAEQSVEKQLHKLGLMGHHSKPEPPPVDQTSAFVKSDEDCDEILEEIIKYDNELAQLREMNKKHLTDIYERCCRDYYQQKIKTKISNVDKKILNFKRQYNESWTEEKKIAQLSEENKELQFFLHYRSQLLLQMQSMVLTPSSSLSQFLSDDSESSNEESDQSEESIKTEVLVHGDTSEKQNDKIEDECSPEENVEHNVKVNIEQEFIDEVMDCEEVNQNNENRTKQNEQNNGGVINNEEMVKHDIEKSKTDEDENFQDCQTEFIVSESTNDKVDKQIKIKEYENNDILKSIVKGCLENHQKSISENEEASKIPLKTEQEPKEYEHKLNPSDVTIDGIKRGLKPRELNNSIIYFEPYDGTSEDSDFTDLSD